MLHSKQGELYEQGAPTPPPQHSITIGTVIDTNDPQQMGRVRVLCHQWGDSWSANVEDIPWAIYGSPLGGQVQTGARGPGAQESDGGVAYGVWWIPTVNSQVLVMCIDGNPSSRVYLGCIFDQFTPHTMPHGRFMYDDHPELEKTGSDAAPYGPYTSTEKLIHPSAENLKQAFGNQAEPNFEWRSRAADYTVSRVDVSQLNQTFSSVQDDKDVTHDDWISTQGYQTSRVDPHGPSPLTDRNYDSHVYSMTTPGFHAFSMDDRQENCRMRWRSASGAQFIIDDTNERIYIATAKGNNWIELDEDGNIDVFTVNKINIHSVSTVNITSDDTVRIYGKKGVHIKSDADIRVDAATDIGLTTPTNIQVNAGAELRLTSGSHTQVNASGDIILTGQTVQSNSATAALAVAPPAFWTNRVPLHEPWARTMTKTDFTHDPEFTYTDKNVNRMERGRVIHRGMFWRR